MNDQRSSDERQQHHDEAKAERKMPGVEKLLRQFLTVETGQGKSPAYRRGHEFAFEWPEDAKKLVNERMEQWGETFDQAFDAVKAELSKRDAQP